MKNKQEHIHGIRQEDYAILEALASGVQVNDCDGVITFSNQAHHSMLGYPAEELLGKRIWELLPDPAERESLRIYFAGLVEDQPPPVPYLTTSRRKDGSIVHLQVDWSYTRDADGVLSGFLSVITDISNSHIVKGSLRHRSQGLATLVEVSRNLSTTLDLDSVLQTTVDGVTRVAGLDTAVVYLLDGETLILKAIAPPVPLDFPDDLRRAALSDHPHICAALTSREPVVVPDIVRVDLTPAERSAVEARDLRSIAYVPLIADAEVLGAFIVASVGEPTPISDTDVDLTSTYSHLAALAIRNAQLFKNVQDTAVRLEETLNERTQAEKERLALEAQLHHAQKMESVGRLAGGVAHDFNNMLGVILGHTELGLSDLDPSDPLHDEFQQIQSAARRSAELTSQLLAFARKQTISPRVVDLNATIDSMLKMIRTMIGDDIDLVWKPNHDLGSVKIDPVQVDQILANLCVNARDAIFGVGRVMIETNNAEIDEAYCDGHPGYVPGSYVMIAVSDNGCGMDQETVVNIFEPFFSTKAAGEGTGLGLSTVYGIVKQNNGFINVYSEPGRGTTFKIYLSRERGAPDAARTGLAQDLPAQGSETVLVVEDETMLLRLCQRMLVSLGYNVLTANSPTESLKIAESWEGSIDLLITDVVMPEMNGPQLVSELRRICPALKTLYMSGYTANVIVHHGILDERTPLISKPFSRNELALKIRESIEGTAFS